MLPAPIRLTGITWNHTRGYTPMVATAQRFCEMRPIADIAQKFTDPKLLEAARKV
jgi:multiple sugar transport system substrate-binding protein